MTSVINLFSNFNDLSKPKTIIDTPSNYNKKNTEPDMLKTSLQQGSNKTDDAMVEDAFGDSFTTEENVVEKIVFS